MELLKSLCISLAVAVVIIGAAWSIGNMVRHQQAAPRIQEPLEAKPSTLKHHYKIIVYRQGEWYSNDEARGISCRVEPFGSVQCAVLMEIPQ